MSLLNMQAVLQRILLNYHVVEQKHQSGRIDCKEALKYIIPQLPPVLFNNLDFIQTDNGLEYQHRFLTFLSQAKQEFSLPHHIKHHYIHKSSPNENAVIEHSFRTDEEEFFWRLDNQPKDLITE